MKVVILSIILLAIAFLLLSFKVLLIPGARFPMGHHAHGKNKDTCLHDDLKS